MKLLSRILLLLLCVGSLPATAQEQPVEIRVLGRQPGPPMWLVKHGENELWIFAHLSPIPKDMIWEADKVAAVIARSQEALGMREIGVGASPLLYLNPVNLFRGMRLAKRLVRNPDKETLEDVLPPELYARFSALKAQYFPRDKDIEKRRPLVAGGQMRAAILEESGLVQASDVTKEIERLLKRNKKLKRTPIEVKMDIKGSFSSLADRAEAMMDSFSKEMELTCFESQLTRMETDIREMQIRADSWARGYIDEFKGLPMMEEDEDPCQLMVMNSSEEQTIEALTAQVDALWLAAAETALNTNTTTFAILDIEELLSKNGLLEQLKSKGYEVKEP